MAPQPKDSLIEALKALNLDARGHKKELARRLKVHNSKVTAARLQPPPPPAKTRPEREQFDSYLVVDVEATCERIEGPYGKLAFSYPNEIIEWPVLWLKWIKKRPRSLVQNAPTGDGAGTASASESTSSDDDSQWELVMQDEYHSFVQPTWGRVSEFCTELTGISQADVEHAPTYPELLDDFENNFIKKNGLFTPENQTCWATDGPWDLRDFIAKASHISGVPRPAWLAGKMLDIRLLSSTFFSSLKSQRHHHHHHHHHQMLSRSPSPPVSYPDLSTSPGTATSSDATLPSTPRDSSLHSFPHSLPLSSTSTPGPLSGTFLPPSSTSTKSLPVLPPLPNHALTPPPLLSLPSVLLALDLPPFQGRLHSGLCDARNAARILVELARRGVALAANRVVPEGGRGREKSWGWMGKDGTVLWTEFFRSQTGSDWVEAKSLGGGGTRGWAP